MKNISGEHEALCNVWKPGKDLLIKGKKLPKIILFDSFMFDSEHKMVHTVPMIFKKYVFQSGSLPRRHYVL